MYDRTSLFSLLEPKAHYQCVGYVDRCGECHIPIPIHNFMCWVYCVVLLRLAVHETNQERRSMIDYENPDVLTLRKWLNEESTSPIDRLALARVLAMVAAEADLYANVAYSAGFVEGERAAIVAQSAPQAAQPVREPTAGLNPLWVATHPDGLPQPVREPLTLDRIQQIYINTYNTGYHGRDFEMAFVRAIERAHGIGSDV
jgi:hypothetical protein